MKQLREIAHIQTGLFARTVDQGNLAYLQARHFNEHGELQTDLKADLLRKDIAEKHILKDGDILLSAKGANNFATCYQRRNIEAAASSSFLVIRITNNRVLPEFVAWFLNLQSTQKFLKDNAPGTSMASISKSVIEDLNLPIPALEVQRSVVAVDKLATLEKKISERLNILKIKKRQLLFEKIIQST